MKIIAVAGQMRNGKNEVGGYICKKTRFTSASFASPVKKIFCDAFSVDMEFVEKWKVNQEPPEGFKKSVRQALQFIGDGFRQIYPDVWVEYAIKNNPDYSCYEDGRYFNELAKVKQKGGINILVWRPGYENNDPNLSESQIKPIVDWYASKNIEGNVSILHNQKDAPKEAQLVDFFLINNKDLESLYIKIDQLILPFLS
jgi:hypothetical protein